MAWEIWAWSAALVRRKAVLLPIFLGAFACSGEVEPEPPPPLEITTTTLPNVALGDSYDQKVAAKGGTPPYGFHLADGALPDGIELKKSTGQLTGLAGTPGAHAFAIEARDSAGQSKRQALTLYVTPDALEIVTERLPSGQEGTLYEQTLIGRGGVPPIEWSVVSGALPAGVDLITTGQLSGTPTAFGGFDFEVQVKDAEDKTAKRMLNLFLASLEPMIVTSTIPKARFARAYSVTFSADGGQPPYTWSQTSGVMPDGISIAPDGSLAGSPTEFGDFTFSIGVSDAASRTDQATFTLRVIAPLVITTRAVPQIIRGRSYERALQASGGVLPYTWTVRSGDLPDGIELTPQGVLRGTSPTPTSSEVTFRVQDSEGAQKLALFTLRVSDRFTYEIEPSLAFPPVCTATTVSYAVAEIEVPESMQVEDVDVTVAVTYADSEAPRLEENEKLKLVLFAPDGRRVVLCGNAAGVRGASGCEGRDGIDEIYDDEGVSPQRPLDVFDGMNPQGTWRFIAVVAEPTTDNRGLCEQSGTITRVVMSIRDDTSADDYIVVRGFERNNLVNEPWARISGGNGLFEEQLQLTATVYSVGPNGVREGGAGDDVPDSTALTWTFNGSADLATVTPDGRVQTGQIPGSGQLTASGGGLEYQTRLFVLPPDWNRLIRQF